MILLRAICFQSKIPQYSKSICLFLKKHHFFTAIYFSILLGSYWLRLDAALQSVKLTFSMMKFYDKIADTYVLWKVMRELISINLLVACRPCILSCSYWSRLALARSGLLFSLSHLCFSQPSPSPCDAVTTYFPNDPSCKYQLIRSNRWMKRTNLVNENAIKQK